ncbi:WbqC family protein [Lacinutrix sp. MEBiC02404]
MKIAIMQPYVFPYIGYFQLIHAVDEFVFYDDVNFIKRGYINRNNLLVNGEKHQFVIPCKNISQNKLIKDIEILFDDKGKQKFLKTLQQTYKKAPFFNEVYFLLEKLITEDSSKTISEFAIGSIKAISNYLSLTCKWAVSSKDYEESRGLKKEERLIQVAKKAKATTYINPLGGLELYKKEDFESHDITLHFLKSNNINYKQFSNDFVPWLSMIDVLMFNSILDIKKMLNEFELI